MMCARTLKCQVASGVDRAARGTILSPRAMHRFVITREEAVAKGAEGGSGDEWEGRGAARVGDELLAACQTLEKQEAPSPRQQKELERIDAAAWRPSNRS